VLTTLFHIPSRIELAGLSLPLLGWGLLLAVWAVISVAALAWTGWRQGMATAVRSLTPPLAGSGAIIAWGLPALDDGQGVPIRGYGVMLLAAAAAGTWLSIVRGRAVGIDADTIVGLGLEVFLAGLIGARLFYVIEYHEQFFPPGRSLLAAIPAVLNIAAGGLVVFGAVPTAALAAWWFARRRRLPLLQLADCIAPGLLVGLALGRIGCFLNGCCYGGLCDLPWAMRFPAGSPPWFDQVSRGLLPPPTADNTGLPTLPIHPAQLYAAIDAAILACLAIAYTPFARRDGAVFALVLTLHPISRIVLEQIRVDEPPALGTPLSISQLVSLLLLVSAGGLWWWVSLQPPKALPPTEAEPPA
jgi:phosphatidylglycerol:prolipoprotein diacylglycerol transferase